MPQVRLAEMLPMFKKLKIIQTSVYLDTEHANKQKQRIKNTETEKAITEDGIYEMIFLISHIWRNVTTSIWQLEIFFSWVLFP